MSKERKNIFLIGNPNAGKTSIFNLLTGLNQRTGNFPGVTVDKKVGIFPTKGDNTLAITDLPGTYSLYPNSEDERIAVKQILSPGIARPDALLYVMDATKLSTHLLLFSQLKDLGHHIIVVLNMADLVEGQPIDVEQLSIAIEAPVFLVSSHTQEGIQALKEGIEREVDSPSFTQHNFYTPNTLEKEIIAEIQQYFPALTAYEALLYAHHYGMLDIAFEKKQAIAELVQTKAFKSLTHQVDETMARYDVLENIIQPFVRQKSSELSQLTQRIDSVLTHPLVGPMIFFAVMLLVFQSIFTWASYPMDMIDALTAGASDWITSTLPESGWRDLLVDGIIAGLGGVLIFVPQIAILFFLLALLEEVGYMARVVYLFDRVMQFFGLSGRSLIALISSGACAIPGVMSARTIAHPKERLATILIAPLMSCSARIPVYTVLIAFAVPSVTVWGIFNLQGLAFMGLYVLGILGALLVALVFKSVFKSKERSFLVFELPDYKMPLMRNVLLSVWEKVRAFVWEAGRIIMVISIILWVLASFGPSNKMELAEKAAMEQAAQTALSEEATNNLVASKQLEASYAGHIGKFIEPVVRPLGYDWKIGIALLTSFAAREVFVGTMATIYSIGSDSDEDTVRERMALEINPDTGGPRYDVATSMSLLVFYVFAMMCMGTLAIVKRETKSWKWPAIQFVVMTSMAYFGAWIVYTILS